MEAPLDRILIKARPDPERAASLFWTDHCFPGRINYESLGTTVNSKNLFSLAKTGSRVREKDSAFLGCDKSDQEFDKGDPFRA
jgi:hypothetical protein